LNRSTFALFVALLIHILLLALFWFLLTTVPTVDEITKPKENKIKISLKDMQKKNKESGIIQKKQPQPPKIAPPMPKGSQLKKIVKKPPQKQKKVVKKIPKKTTPPKKEIIKKRVVKQPSIPLISEKKVVDKNQTKITKKENLNPLYAMLLEDKSEDESKKVVAKKTTKNSIDSNIKELYGEKFGELSVAQQEYILDNQEIMRRITQQVLTRQARVADLSRINVNRNDVIEFYLHPNGDMSDFRFLKKTGYFVLDDVTRATIEYAYSKYPRPKEKTLIRYNVFYNLARY